MMRVKFGDKLDLKHLKGREQKLRQASKQLLWVDHLLKAQAPLSQANKT